MVYGDLVGYVVEGRMTSVVEVQVLSPTPKPLNRGNALRSPGPQGRGFRVSGVRGHGLVTNLPALDPRA